MGKYIEINNIDEIIGVLLLVLMSYFILMRRPYAVFCIATSASAANNKRISNANYDSSSSNVPSRVPSYAGIQVRISPNFNEFSRAVQVNIENISRNDGWVCH